MRDSMIHRHIHIPLVALILTVLSSGAACAGSASKYAETRWVGESVSVPAGARGVEISAAFVDFGGVDVRLFLRQFDAAGKPVGDCLAVPCMRPLAPSLLGKPWTHTAVVEGAQLHANAVSVRPIAVVGEEVCSGKPFELHELSVDWRITPVSDKFANWIAIGETITFTGVQPSGRKALRAVIEDSVGRIVADESVDGCSWSWRTDRPGYYEIHFDWLDATNGMMRAAEKLFASDVRAQADGSRRLMRFKAFPRDRQAIVVSPQGPVAPEQASPAFGFHLSLNTGSDFYRRTQYDLIKLLGMSAFIRVQHIGWYKVERTQGVYDWKDVDDFFRCAEAAGYPLSRQIVGIFGTPIWNTTAKDISFGPFKGPHMYAPKNLAPWRDFVVSVLRRYPELERIEIWNEPHLPGYSVFWRDSSPEQFADLMRVAYDAAKGAKPDVTVLMGGIGMRYLPFYERVVALGIVSYFDQLATHCGYDMRAFRDCERRYGAPAKPYFEDEWHTVLYNCSQKERPSEDACGYRMLRNLATLLHEGNTHVTGFGLVCGDHTPEAADFFASAGGIQQVCGLFRDKPFLEPRRAALALRTATDRFRGPVRKVGAWCFGEDGAQKAAVFASDAGNVAFVWNENPRRPDWNPALTGAGGRIVDWEGRETVWSAVPPQVVCFVENPDCVRLAAGGHALDRLGFFGAGNANHRPVEEGVYVGGVHPARPNIMTNAAFGCSFSVTLSESQLVVDMKGDRPLKELTFALDVEGRGSLDDVIEFSCTHGGAPVKLRTPALYGDIPPDFSPAGVALTKSRVDSADGGHLMRLVVAMSDLYPFIYSPGRYLRVFARVRSCDGATAEWGSGWGTVKHPVEFGRLLPSGGGRVLGTLDSDFARFGESRLTRGVSSVCVEAETGDAGAGLVLKRLPAVPGSRITVRFDAKGRGVLHVVAWAKGANGVSFKRLDAERYRLSGRAESVTRSFALPETSAAVDLAIFSWKDATANFEISGLEIVND